MSAAPSHWHAPRDAAQTPWYSPQGWFNLAAHHTGHGYRNLWQAVLALHQTLPSSPKDVPAPTAAPQPVVAAAQPADAPPKAASSSTWISGRSWWLAGGLALATAALGAALWLRPRRSRA